ncbi:helix-turn-helix transcriptional regulator [Inquilinus sp. YAF38]|uniref:helix-turn-helix transcriptional regulator n=1 Tax=Inquilinus sp. YAF38 TaxID=3233084 RepID=UPI003F8EE8D8
MELLERDHELQTLAVALGEAVAGEGRIALVSGEAGIGKTSFVDRFIATAGRPARLLKGQCDSLSTPSPLGPLYDVARQTGGRLSAQLEAEAPRAALFSTMLDLLRGQPQPVILLVEDVHWADEATLDLIKYLGRRIAESPVLIVLTYRDDEVGAQHPLRLLLGDLAMSRIVRRIELRSLTVDAVRRLVAELPFDALALHRQTGGNPFFLAEVLEHAGRGVPQTVYDAVLARAAKLRPAARAMLEAAAVIGSRVEHALLERVQRGAVDGLSDCLAAGLLAPAETGVAFRHELVRDAVLAGLDPGRRREICRAVLDALRSGGRGDDAQLAHFAEGAGDGAAVLEFGPAAARAAAAAGAHCAAANQYRRVLAFAANRAPTERARLLEAYAQECAIVDDLAEAARARDEAIQLWRRAGDRLREGENLAALAWPLVRSGRNAAAEEASRRAIETLEAMPPTRQLADAYRIQAHLRMLHRDRRPAVRWGRKAIALATRLDDDAIVAAAENVVGSAMLVFGNERGRPHLERGLALARKAGLDALVGQSYSDLGSCYGEQYSFTEAEGHLASGITYTAERDLDHANHYMRSWLALTRLYQGRWDEAAEIATALIEGPHVAMVSRIMALVALGRVRARRGDPGVAAVLDEALDLALQTDTLQRLAPVRTARAEAAWLSDQPERTMAEAAAAYELAVRHGHRWHAGEFSFWRWRAGDRNDPPRWAAPPFLLQVKGDWQGAAAAWDRLGCPYEQARALADGDMPARLTALEIFDRLGAAPAAAALRQRMRVEGVRRVPRGPRAATRHNPLGLTPREMQILDCLTQGLSNGQIGTRLHVSPKTVDHHVSSVLAKLGACTRGEAARIALEQRLLPQNGEGAAAK